MLDVSFVLVGNDRPWARKMVASVREYMPAARIVQMSDEDTDCIADDVIRRPYDGRMMTFRLDHLAAFAHDRMLILDDDCIVRGDVLPVFDTEFDVALTRRTAPAIYQGCNMTETCPYNTGVMFSKSSKFWQRAAQVCRALPDRFQRWWGDQMAVAVTAEKSGYRIHELDTHYNWTPLERGVTSDALIWHYKGLRKEWI